MAKRPGPRSLLKNFWILQYLNILNIFEEFVPTKKQQTSWNPEPNRNLKQYMSKPFRYAVQPRSSWHYPVAFSGQRQHDHAFAPWLSGCQAGKELGLEICNGHIFHDHPFIHLLLPYVIHHHTSSCIMHHASWSSSSSSSSSSQPSLTSLSLLLLHVQHGQHWHYHP